MIENIIFDVGNVLMGYDWKSIFGAMIPGRKVSENCRCSISKPDLGGTGPWTA